MVPYRRPYTRREYLTAVLVVVGAFVAGVMYDASIAETKQAKIEGLRVRDSEKLQKKIDETRSALSRLTTENESLISEQNSATRKHATELKACEARVRDAKAELAKYQTREKDLKASHAQLEDLHDDLEQEKKKAFEMEIKAKTVSDRLEETKATLDEIQRQKEESNRRYEAEIVAQKKSGRNAVAAVADSVSKMAPFIHHLASLQGVGGSLALAAKQKILKEQKEAGGKSVALGEVQKLIEKMNSDIVTKQTMIAELMERKKLSDTLVRKMESKLLEAGVDPSELEKLSRKPAHHTPKLNMDNNPALRAASQVVQGSGNQNKNGIAQAKAQITFGKVDDNGDDTIDFLEFQRATHMLGGGDERSRTYKLSKHKFDQLDTDRSGYITMDEVMSKGAQKFNQVFQEAEDAGAADESAHLSSQGSASAAVQQAMSKHPAQIHDTIKKAATEMKLREGAGSKVRDNNQGAETGKSTVREAKVRIQSKRGKGNSKEEDEEEEEEGDQEEGQKEEGGDEEMPVEDEAEGQDDADEQGDEDQAQGQDDADAQGEEYPQD